MTLVTNAAALAQRIGLPAVEPWYCGGGSLDEAITSHPNAEAIFSFDAEEGKGYKVYHAAASRDAFLAALRALPEGKRHAYEVVRETEACKCYWDVEYYCRCCEAAELAEAQADSLVLMRRAVAHIARQATHELGDASPRLIVLEGSRHTRISVGEAVRTGLVMADNNNNNPDKIPCYKFSFHIILASVAFEINHGQTMRGFVERALPRLASLGADLKWVPTPTTETAPDGKVYGRRQNFRMLGCSKRGGQIPLRHVTALCASLDPLDACITYTKGLRLIASSPSPADEEPRRKRAAPVEPRRRGPKALPFPAELMQELLAEAGDTVSRITNVHHVPVVDEWQVQCDQKKQRRVCLIDRNRTHESNNCLLSVKKDRENQRFQIRYFCTGGECARGGHERPILGYIQLNPETLEWSAQDKHTASAPAAQGEEEEYAEDEIIDPDDPDSNSYEAVKARVERTCFKVGNPFCYAKVAARGDVKPQLFSPDRLRQYFANLYFFETNEKGGMSKSLFVTRWMGDVRIREVSRIVCDPLNLEPKAFNMWRGFAAERLPPIPPGDVAECVAPIVNHIDKVMTDGNEEHTEWVLDYLANIVQRPHQKTQVAISLFGKQGCGKGILFDFFRTKLLGEGCSKQTSNPLADLFGSFASGLVNSVLVQIDEVTNLKDKRDAMKDLITSDKVRYEQKGKDCIVVQNLANLVFTSNNESTLSIAADDRRFVLFKCNPIFTGDTAYFLRLGRHLDRPEVARGMYQFLMARDLSRYTYHFQASRPKTAYYRAQQLASIPIHMRFLSGIVNAAEPIERLSAQSCYNKYSAFYHAGNYKLMFILTHKAFCGMMESVRGVAKRRVGRGTVYEFDGDALKQFLEDNNEYDEDAAL